MARRDYADGEPAWTPFRRFRDDDERIGAIRCCRDRCYQRAEWVSYCTVIRARVAFCDEHKPAEEG